MSNPQPKSETTTESATQIIKPTLCHSPGPWKSHPGKGHDADYMVFDKDGNFLTCSNAVHAKNAQLIAAAPELLHACRLMVENAPVIAKWLKENDRGAYAQVQAAINKATA